MKTFYCLVFVLVFGVSLAEDEQPEMQPVRNPSDFYKCLACGKEDVRQEYLECENLKPKLGNELIDGCEKEIILEDELEAWSYICENPEAHFKIMDCILQQIEKFTREDLVQLMQYHGCVAGLGIKYCGAANQIESAVTQSTVAQATVTQSE